MGMKNLFALEELTGEIMSYLPNTYRNKVMNSLNCSFFVRHY